jgi:hypothetical protein
MHCTVWAWIALDFPAFLCSSLHRRAVYQLLPSPEIHVLNLNNSEATVLSNVLYKNTANSTGLVGLGGDNGFDVDFHQMSVNKRTFSLKTSDIQNSNLKSYMELIAGLPMVDTAEDITFQRTQPNVARA